MILVLMMSIDDQQRSAGFDGDEEVTEWIREFIEKYRLALEALAEK